MGRAGAGLQMKNHEGYHDPTGETPGQGGFISATPYLPAWGAAGVHISASFWQNKQRGGRIQEPIR